MRWRDRLPTEIQRIIYEFDPTFHHHYSRLVHDDIRLYQTTEMSFYVPEGVHAHLFHPRLWVLETDVPVEEENDDNRQCNVLRFFLDKKEYDDYLQELVGTQNALFMAHVPWSHVHAYLQKTFTYFSTGGG